VAEAAVPPARTGAALLRLQLHHPRRRLALANGERRP
jgi:hypothetical protein